MILEPNKDPMGTAIYDFWKSGRADRLLVLSSMFEDDEMPVNHLFRSESEMPLLERKALSLVRGKVLDVGAGAGCHSVVLQKKGFYVRAVDISPLCCKTMTERGLSDVLCIDVYDEALTGRYDTILMLMNGTGIAGKINRLPSLLSRLKSLLNEGGQVLIDSSDLRYVYENEDGSFDIDLNADYYGEVDYRMVYNNVEGESFDWLYVDFPLLSVAAASVGMNAQIVMEGEHYDYLARLTN